MQRFTFNFKFFPFQQGDHLRPWTEEHIAGSNEWRYLISTDKKKCNKNGMDVSNELCKNAHCTEELVPWLPHSI